MKTVGTKNDVLDDEHQIVDDALLSWSTKLETEEKVVYKNCFSIFITGKVILNLKLIDSLEGPSYYFSSLVWW